MNVRNFKTANIFVIICVCVFSSLPSRADETVSSAKSSKELKEGLVFDDASLLRKWETNGLSIYDLLLSSLTQQMQFSMEANKGNLANNSELFSLSSYKDVVSSLDGEFKSIKFGSGSRFNLKFLTSSSARFVLVGIINRLDRGYIEDFSCGEIRFIYRLAYNIEDRGKVVSSRLPMTINLIYKIGKKLNKYDFSQCQEISKLWSKGEGSFEDLLKNYLMPVHLKTLEINLQIERQGAAAEGSFGGNAIYLLKVYNWGKSQFVEASLENQIDRDLFIKNPQQLEDFKKWLLTEENLISLDIGTLQIPEKFLAKRALTYAPGGLARSSNHPLWGIIKGEDLKENILLKDLTNLNIIKSPDSVVRRLNDISCTGCHQTRAIGGFHFTGRDPLKKYPGNSVFLSGSPHFISDLERRKNFLNSLNVIGTNSLAPRTPDYSRGFSARPFWQKAHLKGIWGDHCFSYSKDSYFSRWTCHSGLVCKSFFKHKESEFSDINGLGVCTHTEPTIGDACEFGNIKTTSFGKDFFKRTNEREVKIQNAMCSPQSQDPGTKTGGFLNGNIRLQSCVGIRNYPEAHCGPLPAAGPGFNACVGRKNFDDCLKTFALDVALRGCDLNSPCRDDYICAESSTSDRGVCVPPYFLFQFRVDGHPYLK